MTTHDEGPAITRGAFSASQTSHNQYAADDARHPGHMHPQRAAALTLAAAALLTLTACSSSSDSKHNDPATQPPHGVTAGPTPSSVGGLPAKPEGAQRVALLAALKVIDPALVADEDKAISNSRNQCSTLTGGGANPDHSAGVRFNTSDDKGKAINVALRATLCPKT